MMFFGIFTNICALAQDISFNFFPYLMFTATALSQSNELISRGIFMAICNTDEKITEVLQDKPNKTKNGKSVD
jgi:hypothetical protein